MSFIPLTKRNTETRRRGLKQLSHQTHTHAAVRHQIVSPDRAAANAAGESAIEVSGGRLAGVRRDLGPSLGSVRTRYEHEDHF